MKTRRLECTVAFCHGLPPFFNLACEKFVCVSLIVEITKMIIPTFVDG